MAGPDGVDPLATLLGDRPRGGWQPRRRRTPVADAGPVRSPSRCPPSSPGWPTAGRRRSRPPSRGCGRPAPRSSPSTSRPLLEAATLLYGGSFVAERYTAVGDHVREHPGSSAATSTRSSPRSSSTPRSTAPPSYFADRERLDRLAARAAGRAGRLRRAAHPDDDAAPDARRSAADPVGVNARLGTYTNFANLLDLAALAVPAGTVARAAVRDHADRPGRQRRAARRDRRALRPGDVDLLVVGAHLSGQPLNHELLAAGGTLLGPAATAPRYRLLRPGHHAGQAGPGPGRAAPRGCRGTPPSGGASIAGEVWRLPAAGFARFMAGLAAPMAIGRVCLDDGRDVLGFLCEPAAVRGRGGHHRASAAGAPGSVAAEARGLR